MKNVYVSNGRNIDLSFIKVKPGDWVVIKPNLVKEGKETDLNDWKCVITDPLLIKIVCEFVCKSLNGKGRVTICDAPQTDSSFKLIAERLGLHDIAKQCCDKYGISVEVVDLRNEEWVNQDGIIVARNKLEGDPSGSISFNLGADSLFYGHPGEGRYYGADYDSEVVNKHHTGKTQEYLICATPIKADVFINMPKLKTHKKTGVTLNLKNLVGINADKNWLPHHTEGDGARGGDEYPTLSLWKKIEQKSVKLARFFALRLPVVGPLLSIKLRKAGTAVFGSGHKVIRSGNWYGNDTTWRMVLDLNRCLLYGNEDGSLRGNGPKRYYCIVDGIIGMEGMGPMQGNAKECGVVIGGTDPVSVDIVAARMMGFDWEKIPVIRNCFGIGNLPLVDFEVDDINVVSENKKWNLPFSEFNKIKLFEFEPHFGWKGHIEI